MTSKHIDCGLSVVMGKCFTGVYVERPTRIFLLLAISFVMLPTYEAAAQVTFPVIDRKVLITSVQSINGKHYVATNSDAYYLEGGIPKRIFNEDLQINTMASIKGQALVSTPHGVYALDGTTATPMFNAGFLFVFATFDVNGDIWLSAQRGAYRIDDGRPKLILSGATPGEIMEVNGRVWIQTPDGVYRLNGDTPQPMLQNVGFVHGMQLLDGRIWVMAEKGAYRFDGDVPVAILKNTDVISVKSIGGKVWLGTNDGAYVLNGDVPTPITSAGITAITFKEINGRTWIGTTRGAFVVEGNLTKRILGDDLLAIRIELIDGKTWIGTNKGAYRIDGDDAVLMTSENLSIQDVYGIDGAVWFGTAEGLYRFDEDVAVSVTPRIEEDSWWKSIVGRVLPHKILIEGEIRPEIQVLNKAGPVPYGDSTANKAFDILMTADDKEFLRGVEEQKYSPVEGFKLKLSSGRKRIYTSVRSKGSKSIQLPPMIVWVIPGGAALSSSLGLIWLTLLIAALALAPYNLFSHRLLMNPWVRKYGSFGLVPLAISVIPPLRWHILKRYRRAISEAPEYTEWQKRFVIPSEEFLPNQFGRFLKTNRIVMLLGEAGIGKTSFLRFLMSCYVNSNNALQPEGVVPIFIPLSRYQNESVDNMIYAQLANYGALTDKDLVSWFLQQGGFLILMDGLNETDKTTRGRINTFADQYRRLNYFCISSQEGYSEFASIKRRELNPLQPEKVNEILGRELGEERARSLITQFTQATYQQYRVPQDLEFAIELIKQNKPLPRTKMSLYEALIMPLFESWSLKGRADFYALLCQRAYEILLNHDMTLISSDKQMPDDLREPLLERKLLVHSGDNYYFRHEVIRAFLAAKYFSPRWEELVSDPAVVVDANWRPMLEFTISILKDSDQVKHLMYSVLIKNKHLAGDLYMWLKEAEPALCRDWTEEFERAFGKAILG